MSDEHTKVWAGGYALAQYIKENPDTVKGKSVLDVATGTGVVAKAADEAGASSITVNDVVAAAVDALPYERLTCCFTEIDPGAFDVVLVADHWYSEGFFNQLAGWLVRYKPTRVFTSSVHYDEDVTVSLKFPRAPLFQFFVDTCVTKIDEVPVSSKDAENGTPQPSVDVGVYSVTFS